MKTFFLSCVALTALIGQASATTIEQNSTLPSGPYTSPSATTFSGDVRFNLTGSEPGIYRSPFEGTSAQDTGLFTSIEGTGSATFNVSGDQFSLIWGSPDSYNQLAFYSGADGGGSLLDTITGSSINPANGTGFSAVTISGLGTFGSVKLINDPGSNAFEVSSFNVSSVPLPAGLPMFGGAILALGGLAMVRRGRATARVKAAG